MATNGGIALSLIDWAHSMDPDGKTATIVELLNQKNDVLIDMRWIEGNLPTGHRVTVRTGLPSTTWRTLNSGVAPSKADSAQIDESCGILEAWLVIDKDLAELNGNTASFRLSQAMAFIEAMNQAFVKNLIYGNTAVNPERFLGLDPRFNTISGAVNAQNIIDGSGTGSVNTSVWLVVWGDDTVHGIFPKGSMAGLVHEDYGLETVQTSATSITTSVMRAYRERWQWKCGLVVKDWRYIVRICNIDSTNLVSESGNTDLLKTMSRAMIRPLSLNAGMPVFYMNRTVFSMLQIQGLNKSNAAIAVQPALDQFGNPTGLNRLSYMGIPVRIVDQILNTESRIT